jgi:hypothetical protein
MANEQSPDRQVYDWDASVTDCIAFSVEVNALNELVITENTNNELGGTCTDPSPCLTTLWKTVKRLLTMSTSPLPQSTTHL